MFFLGLPPQPSLGDHTWISDVVSFDGRKQKPAKENIVRAAQHNSETKSHPILLQKSISRFNNLPMRLAKSQTTKKHKSSAFARRDLQNHFDSCVPQEPPNPPLSLTRLRHPWTLGRGGPHELSNGYHMLGHASPKALHFWSKLGIVRDTRKYHWPETD